MIPSPSASVEQSGGFRRGVGWVVTLIPEPEAEGELSKTPLR